MKGIQRLAVLPQTECVLAVLDGYLAKRKEGIVLLDREGKLLRHVPYPFHVHRLVLSRDEGIFYPLSCLFESEAMAYSLQDFQRRPSFDVRLPKESILRDAIALPDSSLMFLCERKAESYLLHLRKDGTRKTFLEGEGMRIDEAFYAENINAILLFSKGGSLSYFAEGRIQRRIEVPTMDKIRPLGKGNVLLGNAPQGFFLLSGNGRVLRKMDFLVPKAEGKEGFRDFVLDWRRELCLYWTTIEDRDAFYLFSTKDFSLLDYSLERKKETIRIAYDGQRIYLHEKGRIVVSRFRD